MIHILKNNDQILILEHRKVVEYGPFWKLKQNPNSKLHNFRITDLQLVHYRSTIIKTELKESTSSQDFC